MRLKQSLNPILYALVALVSFALYSCGAASEEDLFESERYYVPTFNTLGDTMITLDGGAEIVILSALREESDGVLVYGDWSLNDNGDEDVAAVIDPDNPNQGLQTSGYVYEILEQNRAVFTFYGVNTIQEFQLFAGDFTDVAGGVRIEFTTSDDEDGLINQAIDLEVVSQTLNGEVVDYTPSSATLTDQAGNDLGATSGTLGDSFQGSITTSLVNKNIIFTITPTGSEESFAFPVFGANASALLSYDFDIDYFPLDNGLGVVGNYNPYIMTFPVTRHIVEYTYEGASAARFGDVSGTLRYTQPDVSTITNSIASQISTFAGEVEGIEIEYDPDSVNRVATVFLGNALTTRVRGDGTTRSALVRVELTFTTTFSGTAEFFFEDEFSAFTEYYNDIRVSTTTWSQLTYPDEIPTVDVFDLDLDGVVDDTLLTVSRPHNDRAKFAEGRFLIEDQ